MSKVLLGVKSWSSSWSIRWNWLGIVRYFIVECLGHIYLFQLAKHTFVQDLVMHVIICNHVSMKRDFVKYFLSCSAKVTWHHSIAFFCRIFVTPFLVQILRLIGYANTSWDITLHIEHQKSFIYLEVVRADVHTSFVSVISYCYMMQNKQSHRRSCYAVWCHTYVFLHIQ